MEIGFWVSCVWIALASNIQKFSSKPLVTHLERCIAMYCVIADFRVSVWRNRSLLYILNVESVVSLCVSLANGELILTTLCLGFAIPKTDKHYLYRP